ncbi:MAG: AraC family transcriptional regulator [Bacteroidetes bacterium]|nr:AraC family transcriptional regulator [Bacteroidota bacterium]
MHYLHVATATLILFTISLILGRQKQLSDWILISWLIVFFANVATFFILELPGEHTYPLENIILGFSDASVFLHGPLFWLYTCALTRPGFRFQWRHVLHLVPFLIFFGLILSGQIYNSETSYFTVKVESIVKFISILAYLLAIIFSLLKYRRHVEDIFSNAEKKYLDWLWSLSLAILALWIIGIISTVRGWIGTVSPPVGDGPVLKYSTDFFIVLMSYFGFRQSAIFEQSNRTAQVPDELNSLDQLTSEVFDVEKKDSPKYLKSGLNVSRSKEIHVELLRLMEFEKPYMDEELTLFSLAGIMKIPPNHLSQVINTYEHRNFFDFINYHRVEEIKKIIHSDKYKNYSLLGIGFECGFNSKAAFNRAFKKFVGQTPSEFKKSGTGGSISV